MNKIIGWIVVILILIVGGVWLAKKPSAPATPPNSEPIKIGVIVGLTGAYAAVGESYVQGATLAAEDLNKSGSKVELKVENDEFDPKKALSAYEKLTGIDKVNALVSETTPSIEAIYNRVVELGIPVMQGGEQSTDPTDDNVIQIQPGYYQAEMALGKYVKDAGYKNVVALVENYPAMLRFFKGFQAGYGGDIKQELVNFGDKDMRTHALKASQPKPDAIVFLMFPDDGALLLKELNTLYKSDNRPKYVFDGNFQVGLPNYKNILGDLKFLDGSIVGIVTQNMSQEFIDAYKTRWGAEPKIGAEYGYDAVKVLAATYKTDKSEWLRAIKSLTTQGVSGTIRFDEAGVRIPEFKNTTIKDGQIVN